MSKNNNIRRILNIIGVICIIAGTLDPMEGSLLITPGAFLIAICKNRRYYWMGAVAIVIGVFFLFYLSNLGGFGGNSHLSIWWGLAILPYPLGLIFIYALLIYDKIDIKKQLSDSKSKHNKSHSSISR